MNIAERIYNSLIKGFGDIKVFRFPFFLVYDPGSYLVKGEDIRQVINTIQPGDIVLRGYVNYLDGYFIPGFFSHAGLYLGPVHESDRAGLTASQLEKFRAGQQMVIHSMAEGVFMDDIINFCRCDYMLILRRKPECESPAGQKIGIDDVKRAALANLGTEYDFRFDFEDFTAQSCTEFVYHACKGFIQDYGIEVRTKRVLFMKKRIIQPDDFLNSKLELVWKNAAMTEAKLKKALKQA